jgi:hypothetical protein
MVDFRMQLCRKPRLKIQSNDKVSSILGTRVSYIPCLFRYFSWRFMPAQSIGNTMDMYVDPNANVSSVRLSIRDINIRKSVIIRTYSKRLVRPRMPSWDLHPAMSINHQRCSARPNQIHLEAAERFA